MGNTTVVTFLKGSYQQADQRIELKESKDAEEFKQDIAEFDIDSSNTEKSIDGLGRKFLYVQVVAEAVQDEVPLATFVQVSDNDQRDHFVSKGIRIYVLAEKINEQVQRDFHGVMVRLQTISFDEFKRNYNLVRHDHANLSVVTSVTDHRPTPATRRDQERRAASQKPTSGTHNTFAWFEAFSALPEGLSAAFLYLYLIKTHGKDIEVIPGFAIIMSIAVTAAVLMERHYLTSKILASMGDTKSQPFKLDPNGFGKINPSNYAWFHKSFHAGVPFVYAATAIQAGLAIDMSVPGILVTMLGFFSLALLKSMYGYKNWANQNKETELKDLFVLPGLFKFFEYSGLNELIIQTWAAIEWYVHYKGMELLFDTIFPLFGITAFRESTVMSMVALVIGHSQTTFTRPFDIVQVFKKLRKQTIEDLWLKNSIQDSRIHKFFNGFIFDLLRTGFIFENDLQNVLNGTTVLAAKALLLRMVGGLNHKIWSYCYGDRYITFKGGQTALFRFEYGLKTITGLGIGAAGGLKVIQELGRRWSTIESPDSIKVTAFMLGLLYLIANAIQAHGKSMAAIADIYSSAQRKILPFLSDIGVPKEIDKVDRDDAIYRKDIQAIEWIKAIESADTIQKCVNVSSARPSRASYDSIPEMKEDQIEIPVKAREVSELLPTQFTRWNAIRGCFYLALGLVVSFAARDNFNVPLLTAFVEKGDLHFLAAAIGVGKVSKALLYGGFYKSFIEKDTACCPTIVRGTVARLCCTQV